MALKYVDVNPTGDVKAVVIWLHGLGDSGHGFAPIVPELNLPADAGIRFVFPHAPVQPVTINGGMAMNSWYDIKSMDPDNRADEDGVKESVLKVRQLLDAEIAKGVPPERIVIAGFSQGGVISLHLSTRLEFKLAGVMAMSTYMCKPQKLADEMTVANCGTPIYMAHGSYDQMVPMMAGQQACQTLKDNGFDVSWHQYPMEHSVCAEQIRDIREWLLKVL